ncbi:type IV secretion system DNA-binding domain-containing protein [Stakelama marina]|uniref:Type IV secretion system DNA-binding domain-containing protein n=1 Tax=Stakelama marina TaxID=2826939 RepID=A0A8T4IIN7_9SPHN|nr:type IV secretion system DNA-binding domain-containing protein [Stakelama marina]MBR0552056.1 type IV secretion system DNA-binding domain-containing protein [Stakelama marina]
MSRALEASRGRVIEAHRSNAVLTLLRVAALGGLLGMVLGAVLTWTTTRVGDRVLAQAWLRHEINQHLNPAAMLRAQQTMPTGFEAVPSPEQVAATGMLHRLGYIGVPLAVLFAIGIPALLARQWVRASREAARDQVKRGNRMVTAQELASLLAWARKNGTPIELGGVPIPPANETRHLLAVGQSGSGKSTALRGLVRQIAARGEHALLYDPDTSYIRSFYRPERGDIILNVWDARTARWNPLADIADPADAYRLAAILLPLPKGRSDNDIWYEQARAVIARIIYRFVREGRTDLHQLATTLTVANVDELRELVARTEAARAFEPGAEKASSSVAFMLSQPARIVAMLAAVPMSAQPFSFDAFYAALDQHEGDKPLIFLTAPRRYRDAGLPVVTAWLDAAAAAILQRGTDAPCRAWLFLDELPSLPPITSLMTLFPEGRKYGAAITIAFQSVAQLRDKYGEEGVHIITGQTATQLIMAVGDHATATWAVELCGQVEVENQRTTESLDDKAKGERGSFALHRERKSLILDSEVMALKTGQAFLRVSGSPLAKITIDQGPALPPIAPAWVPAPIIMPDIAPAPDDAAPAPARIEDGDDWLMAGPC